VLPLEIDAGIATPGDDELDMQLAVAVCGFGEKIDTVAVPAIEQYPGTFPGLELLVHAFLQLDAGNHGPLGGLGVSAGSEGPALDVLAVEQGLAIGLFFVRTQKANT